MPKIFVTRAIPEAGVKKIKDKGYEVVVSPYDRVLSKDELVKNLKSGKYDAVLCLLTDKIDVDVFDAAGPQVKIFANMAVGFDNIDLKEAEKRAILVANTPGVLTDAVAEHAFVLMLAVSRRVVEADRFVRAHKFKGWEPALFLGNDFSRKILGVVGLGRIGSRVVHYAVKGFGVKAIYNDVSRNEEFEREYGAVYKEKLDDLLREADYISIHVPLLESTRHLIDAEKLKIMKATAYLINTSRGPIIDEKALVEALKNKTIRGAAIDVFENEPLLSPGLSELENVVLTPHIASATEETRAAMAELAADNIIAALEGKIPPNLVKKA